MYANPRGLLGELKIRQICFAKLPEYKVLFAGSPVCTFATWLSQEGEGMPFINDNLLSSAKELAHELHIKLIVSRTLQSR